MRPYRFSPWTILFATIVYVQLSPSAVAGEMEKKVETILRQTATLLQSTPQFTFTAEETRDVATSTGVLLSVSHTLDLAVQRPNKLHHAATGDVAQRTFWYDGSTATFLDMTNGVYATRKVPGTLDEALTLMTTTYNVDLPLSQLTVSRPYDVWTRAVQAGFYAGLHQVDGVRCHHLVFVQDELDWQLWIEDSDTPLPRKLVIAFRNQEGIPRYHAIFKQWNLTPQLSANHFAASIPSNVKQVAFQPAAK